MKELQEDYKNNVFRLMRNFRISTTDVAYILAVSRRVSSTIVAEIRNNNKEFYEMGGFGSTYIAPRHLRKYMNCILTDREVENIINIEN